MPPTKRASSRLDGNAGTDLDAGLEDEHAVDADDTDDALGLAAEAEAEAAAAEAEAAAARARARALRLRRQAAAAAAKPAPAEPEVTVPLAADEDGVAPEADDADDPADPADEDVSEPALRRRRVAAPRTRLSWLRWIAASLAVLCTLGFLGASGYMIVHHRHAAAEHERTAEFQAAARQGVVTLMSLNYNSAKDDVKRILDNTTGDFKKDFASQSDEFAKVAQSSQVITQATVTATAVQTMAQDTATVLVAVTTQVSNAASKQQEPRSWRLRVDLARDGGQLKLAKVEFVP